MSTVINAPITLTTVAINAPVSLAPINIVAPITLGYRGLPGADGLDGEDGADGASAYSIYLQTSGDEPLLTEAEWSASRSSILAAGISDSTTLGRSLLTAETASAARTSLKVPGSDPTGIAGASTLGNIVSLTQASYDALVTKDPATLYVIA